MTLYYLLIVETCEFFSTFDLLESADKATSSRSF